VLAVAPADDRIQLAASSRAGLEAGQVEFERPSWISRSADDVIRDISCEPRISVMFTTAQESATHDAVNYRPFSGRVM